MVPSNHNRRNGDREEIRIARAESESLIQTILRGLATIKNRPVADVEPLYKQIDMDAVTALLDHARRSQSAVGIEFTIDDYTVQVSHDQEVYIHDGAPRMASITDR